MKLVRAFPALVFLLALLPALTGATWLPLVKSGGGGGTGWCGLVPVQGSLVNCWPIDTAHTTSSLATDVTGGKNATLTNITLNGSGPSTNLNNAVNCNGTSSTALSTLANLPTSAFTISFWVNPAASGSNVDPFANGCPDCGGNTGFRVVATSAGPTYSLKAGNGVVTASVAQSGATVGSWFMQTWTWNGATITPYQNGTAGTGSAFVGTLSAGSANVGFCYNPSFPGDFVNTLMSGIAIWNTALTSGQVTTLAGL